MSNVNAAKLAEALENCASEPVHIPGTIQPHGYLLTLADDLSIVTAVSDNIGDLFAISIKSLFSESPSTVLPKALYAGLEKALSRLESGAPNWCFDCRFEEEARDQYYCTCYFSDKSVVLEIEPVVSALADDYVAEINVQLEQLRQTNSVQQTLEQLTKSIAVLTGYDRVLVYQFDNDWNGRVEAETLAANDLHSYLGHSFPASDIPPQVRALYQQNVLRDIADATVSPATLLQNPAVNATTPLDLTAGVLRGVSPIHLKYLANMGVRRALSVALFNDSKLWGLLSCHGLTQQLVHPYQRDAIKALVGFATERMLLQREYEAGRFYAKTEQSRKALLDPKKDIMNPEELLTVEGERWLNLFNIKTVAMVHGKQTTVIGAACDAKVLIEAASWLEQTHFETGLFSTSELATSEFAELFSELGFCGLLAVALPYDRSKTGWLLFLRGEVKEIRNWAGQPEKTSIESYQGKDVLSPRKSFESWQEIVNGKSIEWRPEEKQAARFLAEDLAIGASAYQIEHLNEKLKKANTRLQHLAHTDALTQLWNRYHMEQNVEAQISVAKRHGHDLGIIIFDIDHFKEVNDTYGHDIGDLVLQKLARGLEELMRDGDSFGRWGGEEFLVLALESNLEGTVQLAERLKKKLQSIEFDKVGQITASFGVAVLQPNDGRISLVKRADEALYEAKDSGRNRVVSRD
ncbi:MAG: diguanylate cyclase [Idiomarina sp.]|nr:diguanylate cyclase [Idiomarina sp.]